MKIQTSAAFALLALCTLARAATPVALLTPVLFDPSTDKRMQVRTECKLGEMLETHVGDALRHVNKGAGTTTATDGDVMKVTVMTIWGARGNNWTGPKGLLVHADLLEDGKVLRSVDLHRTTMGGFWGPFKGICGFMERNAEALGRDLANWTRDPKFVPDASPLPPSTADDAASEAGR